LQPTVDVKVMVAMPAATPVTTPDDEPIVAIVPGVAAHVPAPSVSVVVAPTHTFIVPVIIASNGFTVTEVLVAQPVAVTV
jgi:hypothetical protein